MQTELLPVTASVINNYSPSSGQSESRSQQCRGIILYDPPCWKFTTPPIYEFPGRTVITGRGVIHEQLPSGKLVFTITPIAHDVRPSSSGNGRSSRIPLKNNNNKKKQIKNLSYGTFCVEQKEEPAAKRLARQINHSGIWYLPVMSFSICLQSLLKMPPHVFSREVIRAGTYLFLATRVHPVFLTTCGTSRPHVFFVFTSHVSLYPGGSHVYFISPGLSSCQISLPLVDVSAITTTLKSSPSPLHSHIPP